MHRKIKPKNRAAIALTLCFCVMALTSVFAVKANLNKIQSVSDPVASEEKTMQEEGSTETATSAPVVDSRDSSEENNGQAPAYIQPVEGDIILKYSMDSLVYSKTLDQYMTHPGTDIAAPVSSKVKAIADGTVTDVYSDDRFGMTVQITHDNGIISTYSNLAEQLTVENGDTVKQGTVIGCVGKTALFESLEESHLHLQMEEDNSIVDPCDYIDFKK